MRTSGLDKNAFISNREKKYRQSDSLLLRLFVFVTVNQIAVRTAPAAIGCANL
jgi:hypothetical protein